MSRVKMFGAIPRPPHVPVQFFHDHWRHPHGTLGRHISTMRGYVQSHQVHSDLLGPDQTRFEGVAEVNIDSAADAAWFGEEPVYLRDVKDDEPNFVDLPALRWIFAEEEILVSSPDLRSTASAGDKAWRIDNRPTTFKVIQFIEQDGATPWADDTDVALGHRLGALRHVRSRPSPAVHPDGAFAIGVRELWWGSKTHMETCVAADMDAWRELIGRPAVATTLCANAERFF
ncbi:EthD domain-containing protein [Novosphingobium colocasiae]|uniref:EthD domain-containing protein n=1 Tax=Novosphingobium colocasiae TaxID=1256513 RepID=UPI0035AF4502